jgi:gluconate 2-dehydrogenase gamma chain
MPDHHMPRGWSRRKFLQATATAAVACTSMSSCGKSGSSGDEGFAWRFFTVDEARTASAICDRIVPPDDAPGAAALGVVTFIDRQLLGPYRDYQGDYRAGISAVDAECRARCGKTFVDLISAEQDAVLSAIEKGEVCTEWKAVQPKTFFALINDHTLQGYYGDPRHGGNRDGASWKMLAIPTPPVRGRKHPDGVPPRRS